ncbi:MAG: SLATT domain-containing protein, partial [Acidobacteriota bacterium]|nr:SLATT domain-containing protein [Acidobacteriota bacterium]
LKEVLKTVPSLDVEAGRSDFSITPSMNAIRGSSRKERAAFYRRNRVEDQATWYSRKARWNRSSAMVWTLLAVGVEGVAVLLGLLRMLGSFDVNWLGILAASAAGIAAWQQTKNYSSLSEAYAITSHEVSMVRSDLHEGATEEEWAQVVRDSEMAFSREHTLWLARRQGHKT